MKNLYIVGACGSIGTQTLDIVRRYPDELVVKGISVGSNLILAYELINEFKPLVICFREEAHYLPAKLSYKPLIVGFGDEGLNLIASYHHDDNEVFVNALVGIAGLEPTVHAIQARKTIALANKETLVVAGDLIKELVNEYKVNLVPIDSEHSAILQCLCGENKSEVKRLIITASGGSFRDKTRNELVNVTKQEALAHPNWHMGAKITIDSATMMNKGFEVIEAHYLFDIPYEKITTILHKESIVHSLVEFSDGTIKAQLGIADMRIPISYALFYPSHNYKGASYLDLVGKSLNFCELSCERYPCLGYAYQAALKGGVYLAVLNAANEAAVSLFLHEKISFLEIEKIIFKEITNNEYVNVDYTLANLLQITKDIKQKIFRRYGVDEICI